MQTPGVVEEARDEFAKKNGIITTQGFTVVDQNHITLPVPARLTSGTVVVTNGGGSASRGSVFEWSRLGQMYKVWL